MHESVEATLHAAATANITSAALAMRADQHPGTDWREGVEVEDEAVRRTRANSTAPPTLQEAMLENLVVLDAENRGQLRSAHWTRAAIALLEHVNIDDGAEIEQLEIDLQVEQELRGQRQTAADVARGGYMRLLQQQYASTSAQPIFATVAGSRVAVHVADESPARMPMILFESPDDITPAGVAYRRWKALEAEVVRGPESDPRVVRRPDGREQVKETAVLERLAQLRHMSGVRRSRLGQLHAHLERLAEPPPGAVTVVLKDSNSKTEASITVPRRWMPVRL
jgi:hypothetical protein